MAARLVPLVALFVIPVAAAVVRPTPVHACSCSMPMIEVLPRKGTPAPTNSRVLVFIPEDQVLKDVSPDLSKIEIAVRPKKGTSKRIKIKDGKKTKWVTKDIPAPAIETDRRVMGAGSIQIVELTPRAVLSPNTDYIVTIALPDRDPELIGSFTTGTEADTTPPEWTGVKQAAMEKQPNNSAMCMTGRTHAALQMASEIPYESPILMGIWVADADGKVIWTDPPTTYVLAYGKELRLGYWSICSPSSFDFPKLLDRLTLGLRAFDLAGNPSETAAEVVLDLKTKP